MADDLTNLIAAALAVHQPKVRRLKHPTRQGVLLNKPACKGCDWLGDDPAFVSEEHRPHVAAVVVAALEEAGWQLTPLTTPAPTCRCHACNAKNNRDEQFMVLCTDCACKRCPKATNHEHTCTQSNKSGQMGSAYGEMCQQDCCREYRAIMAERRKEFDAFWAAAERAGAEQ